MKYTIKQIPNLYLIVFLLSSAMLFSGCDDLLDKLKGGDEEEDYPELSVNLDSFILPAEGSEYTVAVTANFSDWEIDEDYASWCHVSQNSKGVNVKVDPNPGYQIRYTSVKIMLEKSGERKQTNITVGQSGKNIQSISEITENVLFEKQGGIQSVSIQTDYPEEAYLVTGENWCSYTISGNSLRVTASPYTGESSREALIATISDETIADGENLPRYYRIIQRGTAPLLEISVPALGFSILGGTTALTVTGSMTNWKIITDGNDWYSYQREGNRIKISVKGHEEIESREATLTISAGEIKRQITIVQCGLKEMFEVFPQNLSFSSIGGVQILSTVSNVSLSSYPNKTWCNIDGFGSDMYITTSPNWENTSRETTLTFQPEGMNLPMTEIPVVQEAPGNDQSMPLTGTWTMTENEVETSYTFTADHQFIQMTSEGMFYQGTFSTNGNSLIISGDDYQEYTLISIKNETLTLGSINGNLTLTRLSSPTLSVGQSIIDITETEVKEISVSSNTVWGIASMPEWLFVMPAGNTQGNGKIMIMPTLATDSPIEGTIVIYAGYQKQTITVRQKVATEDQ